MIFSAENSPADVSLTPPRSVAEQAPRFALGQLLSTPGALKLMLDNQVEPISLLQRHVRGDWGTICAEDAQSNEEALECGARLMSSYVMANGGVIWIITEADRSATTCLRPDEY